MPVADDILQIGVLVDTPALQAGMAAATSSVEAGTAAMGASFEATAATTSTSGGIIVEMSAVISGALDKMAASFMNLPAVAEPAIVATEGALSGLQEKLIQVAETAEVTTGGIGAGFGKLAGLLGAGALVGVLGHMADELNRSVIELGHLSEKSGMSISTLAGLREASEEIGVEFGSIETGMIRLSRAQAMAVEGGKAQIAAFQRIGISVNELKGMTPEQLFDAVSGAIQKTGSSADAAASAIALLGRGGAALIPLFKTYGDTLSEVSRKQGEETGVTEDAYRNALVFQKAQANLGDEFRKIALEVMPLLTHALHDVADAFKGLSTGPAVSGIKSFFGTTAGVVNEFIGSMEVAQTKVGEIFTLMSGPGDPTAIHAEYAAKIQKIWAQTGELVRSNMGIAPPISLEDSMARVRKLAEEQFPTKPDLPGEGGGGAEKASEAKAQAEAVLNTQLAAIKAWESAQRVAYESGKTSAEDWANQQVVATNLAYAAQTAYFNKLKTIFASDPTKESIVIQEQAKFNYQETAKAADDLATSYAKLKDILKEYSTDVLKSADAAQKELETDLKVTGKSVEDYVNSLKALGAAQAASRGADFAAQEEQIKAALSGGVISQREASQQLIALYQLEEEARVTAAQSQGVQLQALVTSTQAALSEAERTGNAVRVNEARAAYNNALAAYQNFQTRMQQAATQSSIRIDSENAKVSRSYLQTFTHITGPFNQFISQMITGQATLASAWTGLVQRMASTFINNLMLMVEQAAVAMVMHKAIAKDGILVKAKEAGAWGFAEGMKLPFPIDLIVAPILAAAGFAGVMAFGSFDKGGLVNEDMVGQLHAKEMVLPPALSTGVQNLIASGGNSTTNNYGGGGGDSSSAIIAGDTHVHVHMGDVSAVDAAGVQEVLKSNRREIAKIVQKQIAGGHLNPLSGYGYK